MLDKRSRFSASTHSLLAVCPVPWLLAPDLATDPTPRWRATGVLLAEPALPLVLPVRDIRVLFALKARHYNGLLQCHVPLPHEYFVPMTSWSPRTRRRTRVLCLAARRVDRVGPDVAVALVGRGQRRPVCGGVDEPRLVDAVGDDQQVAGAGQIPVDAAALGQIGVARLRYVGVPPDIELSPVRVRSREEVPVAHRLAEYGVSDVVRGQSEPLDAKEGLSVVGRRRLAVQESGLVQVGATQLEVHADEPMGSHSGEQLMYHLVHDY